MSPRQCGGEWGGDRRGDRETEERQIAAERRTSISGARPFAGFAENDATHHDQVDGKWIFKESGVTSRWRDCHFDDTPCLSLLKHLLTVQGGAIK